MLKNQNTLPPKHTPEQLAEFHESRATFGKGSNITYQLLERMHDGELTQQAANELLERNFDGLPEKNVASWLISMPALLEIGQIDRKTPKQKKAVLASNHALTEMMLDTSSTLVTQQMVLDAALRFALANGIASNGDDMKTLEYEVRKQIYGIHKEQSTLNLLHAAGIPTQEATIDEDSAGIDAFVRLPDSPERSYEAWVEVDIKAGSKGIDREIEKKGAKYSHTIHANRNGAFEQILKPQSGTPVIEVTQAAGKFFMVLHQTPEESKQFAAYDFRGNNAAIAAMTHAVKAMGNEDESLLTLRTRQEGSSELVQLHALTKAGALATKEAAK